MNEFKDLLVINMQLDFVMNQRKKETQTEREKDCEEKDGEEEKEKK